MFLHCMFKVSHVMGNSVGTMDNLGESLLVDKVVGDPDDEVIYPQAALVISKRKPGDLQGSKFTSNQGSLRMDDVAGLIQEGDDEADVQVLV